MKTVTITMEVPANRLAALQEFLLGEKPAKATPAAKAQAMDPVPVPETPAVTAAPEQTPEKKQITKTDLRALGVELTKAGKQDELSAALGKFGAKKLSEVKEEDYEALYKELGGK